ncbi:competence/damage-inducible protein A [Microvirga tunisiensis]|jgi:molybdenum cofactor synthesis domain-containing protein|uniref:Competence/damage-inducible protein A n=1 Tax=Microvirga tunisiensis TaxID=2108360 RepID=A0A5N7MIR8_9HYPH|nr:molybdopterin-binding protein [Microvirga tunisiensis]MPR08377.1 competence/damage-inducible protein A [Microvirga tunisiensis]MPR26600.1 competence/damage-inducible protein A [Microvirga tunisiensis]
MAISVTAALLIIGDEILTGRTKDKNIGYIAEYLTGIGIDLREVRVVPDVEEEIVAAVNALRGRYTYLFTTGGIGPTHDDITADSIAKAFGVGIGVDPRAVALLQERYQPHELNEARLRMARIPEGADLIENPISKAPGFRIGNVFVMAGVPSIMQAMLDIIAPSLQTGARMIIETIEAEGLAEGIYAEGLGQIALSDEGVSIGSYPSFSTSGFRNQIVVRGKDPESVASAAAAIRELLGRLKGDRAPL